jgi:hypothetical protein
MRRTTKHMYAVVRVDKFLADVSPPANTITVKEVVLTQEEAENEVRRLSATNSDKDCLYFWQKTRFVEGPPKPMV